MSRIFIQSVFAAALLTLVGCEHIPMPSVVIKPSPAEKALTELVNQEVAKTKELEEKLKNQEKIFKQNFDANLSLGAASVMAGLDTLAADTNKNKFTLAAIPALEVAVVALPSPSIEDYKKAAETQRKLLSELAAEVEAGQKEIAAQKAEAIANKEAQRKAIEEKNAIALEKEKFAAAVAEEKEKLNKDVVEFKNQALTESENARALQAQEEKRKLEEAAGKKDMQRLLIYILMGFGLVAAIASYVVKSPGQIVNPTLGLVAGTSVALAIALSFIPTWIIATVSGLLILLAGWGLFNAFKNFRDVAEVAVGGVQEYKNSKKEFFKQGVGKNLQEWTADKPNVRENIDKLAKQLNVK